MNAKIKATLDKSRAALAVCEAFCEKYGDRFDENFPGFLIVTDEPPQFHTHVPFVSLQSPAQLQSNTDRLLSAMGKAFGTDGWMRHLNYDRNGFNWKKLLDGVQITIANAEPIGMLTPTPVFPSQFPILLEDAKEAA